MPLTLAKKILSCSMAAKNPIVGLCTARTLFTGKYAAGVYGTPSSWHAYFLQKLSVRYFITFFLLTALRCYLLTAMEDVVLRALNDGGVDSKSLAVVVTKYFCSKSADSNGMFI